MFLNKSIIKKIIIYILVITILLPYYSFALAQDLTQQKPVKYTAISIKTLKLRESMDVNSRGIASIPEGTKLDILGLENDMFLVRFQNREGYVQTKYFKDFVIQSPQMEAEKETPVSEKPKPKEDEGSFSPNESFVEKYIAKPNRSEVLRTEPNENSKIVGTVPKYGQITISKISGDWAFASYEGIIGYIKTEGLVQYDYLDPYAEPFPGIIKYNYAAVIAKDIQLIDQENPSKIHKIIPAGAVISVEEADKNGMMHVGFMSRRHGLIRESDTLELVKVVPYDKAQKGDLISVYTTFFPVHNSNILVIGRVYNMYLGSNMLNGKIIQPGEKASINECIGPYRMELGYKKAPIASKKVDYGYGGGTCQVNTTTYNTLIQVPVWVFYRRVHSRTGAVYAPVGFDAAVGNLASVDMKFENTLPYPILMQYYVSDNVITSLIYRAD